MPSLIEFAREIARQRATGDNRFWRKYLFYFELRVPANIVESDNTFLYPLVINPQSYSLEEPFSLELTPGSGGSLYAEENGIIQRTIKLKGTTGWKPRTLHGAQPASLKARSPEKRSHSRNLKAILPPDALGDVRLSGHAHFMYLQDAIFRTYADLKRDPATSENTHMLFHNFKDDEHWLVAPKRFALTRDSGKSTLYYYDIELSVLDKAEYEFFASEDASILDKVRTAIAALAAGLDLLQGAVNDATALVGQIKNVVKNIGKIIDNVTAVITAVKSFLDGTADLIKAPYAVLKSCRDLVDEALSVVHNAEELRGTAITFPDTCRQIFRSMGDGLDLIGVHPQTFATPAQLQLAAMKARQEKTTSTGKARLAEAAASTPPATFAALEALGTGPLPGDALRAKSEDGMSVGRNTKNYTGSVEKVIEKGDTLVNLAARYLGDARLWQHIAVLNGLKPPFINDQSASISGADLSDQEALSGVLGLGKKILIPTYSRAPQAASQLAVIGVRMEEDAEAHLLGCDFLLEPVQNSAFLSDQRRLYDMKIDVEGGSIDAKVVKGKKNLVQAVGIRCRTEKKTDVLFQNLGVERIIGLPGTVSGQALAAFRVTQAIAADPRIASVRELTLDPLTDQPDLIEVNIEAEVKGFTQGTAIKAIA
jgi:hypothetical protein